MLRLWALLMLAFFALDQVNSASLSNSNADQALAAMKKKKAEVAAPCDRECQFKKSMLSKEQKTSPKTPSKATKSTKKKKAAKVNNVKSLGSKANNTTTKKPIKKAAGKKAVGKKSKFANINTSGNNLTTAGADDQKLKKDHAPKNKDIENEEVKKTQKKHPNADPPSVPFFSPPPIPSYVFAVGNTQNNIFVQETKTTVTTIQTPPDYDGRVTVDVDAMIDEANRPSTGKKAKIETDEEILGYGFNGFFGGFLHGR